MEKTKTNRINVGDEIIVDKGILGTDYGILKSIDGFSCGGFFGTYESYEHGLKTFDQTIHVLKKARE